MDDTSSSFKQFGFSDSASRSRNHLHTKLKLGAAVSLGKFKVLMKSEEEALV